MAMSVGGNRFLLVISINTIIPLSNDIYNDDENNVKRRCRSLPIIKAMHKNSVLVYKGYFKTNLLFPSS